MFRCGRYLLPHHNGSRRQYHFSQIDTNTDLNSRSLRNACIALRHSPLQHDRAFHGVDDAVEFRQQAITHQLENASGCFSISGSNSSLRPARSRLKVRFQKCRITNNVGGQDGRQLAFHGKALRDYRDNRLKRVAWVPDRSMHYKRLGRAIHISVWLTAER